MNLGNITHLIEIQRFYIRYNNWIYIPSEYPVPPDIREELLKIGSNGNEFFKNNAAVIMSQEIAGDIFFVKEYGVFQLFQYSP